jgi:hypothetical protein
LVSKRMDGIDDAFGGGVEATPVGGTYGWDWSE